MSCHRIESVYALVRSWMDPREFRVEFQDGSCRVYLSSGRDLLLSLLLDVCQAAGNVRVLVTGEVSDGLRLMPRFVEENYKGGVQDAFFGANSIEAWYLSKIARLGRATSSSGDKEDDDVLGKCSFFYAHTSTFTKSSQQHFPYHYVLCVEIEQASRALNANVPCPGISPAADSSVVQAAMRAVLRALMRLLSRKELDVDLTARGLCTLLQCLFRIVPCVAGYRGFVEVQEVDTRWLIVQLLRFDHAFVNYWTLELLTALCRCPRSPRTMQQVVFSIKATAI